MFRFSWWRNQNNRDGAKAITDVLKVVVPAGLVCIAAVAGYFGWIAPQDSTDNGGPDTINCDSTFTQSGGGTLVQNCGTGDVQVDGGEHGDTITCNSKFRQDGDGNLIQNCGDGTVIVGLTQDKFFAELEKREAAIRAQIATREQKLRDDLNRASQAEQRALAAEKKLLELELSQVLTDMANLDTAFQETVEELRQLRVELEKYRNVLPQGRLNAAQQALFEGNRAVADGLLAELEDALTNTVKVAADAAFLRGEIAEQEVRWLDAAKHYDRAARLDPHWNTLRKATEFSWRAGNYALSVRHGEDLVETAKLAGDQVQVGAALNEHALALSFLGHFEKAETLYREALEIVQATIGEGHPNYAVGLNNLAEEVKAQGRYAEARPL